MSSQNIYVEPENKPFVLVYDLPSENRYSYRDKKDYSKVRNTRVNCTYKLRSLGVECTRSVILVPASNADKIDGVVQEVLKEYEELNKSLDTPIDMPIIKAIRITVEQKESFKELAERSAKERLDELISKIAELINEIDEILDDEKLKSARNTLNKQRREAELIEKYAKELGIELNHKPDLLYELYNQAIAKIGGKVD